MKTNRELEKLDWESLHKENIERYQIGRPKRGIFVSRYVNQYSLDIASIIEQGAFSAKDTAYLQTIFPHYETTVTDFDDSIVKRLRQQGFNAQKEDARNLSFSNSTFDLSFQSGLIVLFDNDEALKIIREQVRVTKQIAFIFAHNQHNYLDRLLSRMKRYFSNKKIFTFRQFTWSEMETFAKAVDLNYELMHYDNMLVNFCNRKCKWLVPLINKTPLGSARCLSNELVLIIKK